ncbi:MAG: hypothetical protein KGD59_13090 [Candidatus Heimdallarchaeota archaeon]|jgi:hypothetical protein|nr:hypothetical protein [Candidatus Heimdallarchaeota archaeon]MBY8995482.1 hypothetical protein [Candidatus Heimdallarchaeota archaeon]
MSVSESSEELLKRKKEQKKIENGILKAIADLTDEFDWPEGVEAPEMQLIITQLARSAAHLRESNAADEEKYVPVKKFNAK